MTRTEFSPSDMSRRAPATNWRWPYRGGSFEQFLKSRPEEAPVPVPGAREVIARVEAVSICSSDIKVARMGSDHPLFRQGATADTVLGHEVSLRVHAVGTDHLGRFRPGQRLGLQPAMRIGGERRTIGMDLPGGFAQYLVLGPEVLADYVFEVPDSLSAADVALLEPYGCIERAWRPNTRTGFLAGGRALVVLGPEAEAFSLAERPGWAEVAVLGNGALPDFALAAHRITKIGAAQFDDIVALGDLAAPDLEALVHALRPGGLLLQARRGPSPGPVVLDPARIHYEALSLLGTAETDIATALAPDRQRFDVRPGGVALVHGAGGAMGRIHVHRLLELERGPATILASSRKGKRLADLESDFGPLALARGRKLIVVETESLPQAVAKHAPRGLDDAVVVAPEVEAIAVAAALLAPDGLLNVFAGFPFGRRIPLDLAAVAISGLRITGSTGCSVSDMLGVMDRVMSGELDPSRNIKAIAGLRALPAALEAVAHGHVSGKIVVYPGQPDLPLTLLEQAWSRQAERTMMR